MVWFCKNCKENNMPPIGSGYLNLIDSYDKKICPQCGNPLVSVPLTGDELYIITDISHDSDFLEAMIKLKQDDIIDYNLKMAQFRNQLEQQNQSKVVEDDNQVKCPYCNSTDVKKISGTSKVGSVALFGIFAMGKVSKNYHCNNCKSDF